VPRYRLLPERRGHGTSPAVPLRKTKGGLSCPKCGGSTQVTNSRVRPGMIYRMRACADCAYRFPTWESPAVGSYPDTVDNAAAAQREIADIIERLQKLVLPVR
jgi:hypothetical protein